MPDTLTRYAKAFEDFDAQAVVDCCQFPIVAVSGETTTHFETKDAFLPQIKRLLRTYRAFGVTEVRIKKREEFPLSGDLNSTNVTWQLANDTGSPVIEFNHTYVQDTSLKGGPFVFIVSHNEERLWRELIADRRT